MSQPLHIVSPHLEELFMVLTDLMVEINQQLSKLQLFVRYFDQSGEPQCCRAARSSGKSWYFDASFITLGQLEPLASRRMMSPGDKFDGFLYLIRVLDTINYLFPFVEAHVIFRWEEMYPAMIAPTGSPPKESFHFISQGNISTETSSSEIPESVEYSFARFILNLCSRQELISKRDVMVITSRDSIESNFNPPSVEIASISEPVTPRPKRDRPESEMELTPKRPATSNRPESAVSVIAAIRLLILQNAPVSTIGMKIAAAIFGPCQISDFQAYLDSKPAIVKRILSEALILFLDQECEIKDNSQIIPGRVFRMKFCAKIGYPIDSFPPLVMDRCLELVKFRHSRFDPISKVTSQSYRGIILK